MGVPRTNAVSMSFVRRVVLSLLEVGRTAVFVACFVPGQRVAVLVAVMLTIVKTVAILQVSGVLVTMVSMRMHHSTCHALYAMQFRKASYVRPENS